MYRGRWPCAYFHFNVDLFKILFLHIFWQISSRNLKFFKLTEIWYIGRLYCIFFQIFCHSYLFKKIWSQNLKFYKMTENSSRDRWPCAYFCFNVYLFKIVFIHILGQISPKIWIYSDWLNFGTEIGYHILISILIFIFSKLFLLIYLGQIFS